MQVLAPVLDVSGFGCLTYRITEQLFKVKPVNVLRGNEREGQIKLLSQIIRFEITTFDCTATL